MTEPVVSVPLIRVKVWDIWIRLTHWAIVGLLCLSWWSYENDRMDLHVTSGLCLLALLVFRLGWGLWGSATARFARFLQSPWAGVQHLRHLPRREPDTEIGHNAAGGWMVLVMLLLLMVQVGSGLMADDDIMTQGPLAKLVPGWMSEAATRLHGLNFELILIVVGLHLLAVIAYRLFKGHDLVLPMITGFKLLPARMAAQAPRLASPLLGLASLAAAALIAWLVGRLG